VSLVSFSHGRGEGGGGGDGWGGGGARGGPVGGSAPLGWVGVTVFSGFDLFHQWVFLSVHV